MGLFDAVGSLIAGDSSGDALAAQRAASERAAQIQQQMYNQSREDLAVYRDAGASALGKMQDPEYLRNFSMADFQADPGRQYQIDEANKALERSAAARGGLMGGAGLKSLATLNQNLANQSYQTAYDRFNADKDRTFGRLSNIAGMGQSSAAQTAGNAMAYGNNMANIYTGQGNAEAAQIMGSNARQAGIWSGVLDGATSLGMMAFGGGGGAAASAGGASAGPASTGAIYQGGNGGMSVGSANGMYGKGLLFSDRNLKTKVEEISKEELAEMKRNLKAYRFHYKNGDVHGEGEYVGVMAQDLEKSKLGRTLVYQDRNGHKHLDMKRILMLALATMAEG